MRLSRFILLLLVLYSGMVFGQGEENKLPPEGYFLFPINPGQRNYLSGTQGELRPNHFHGGLDIKTGGREGAPVRAAADGYVQRVKVNSYGYGWVLYVMHPNGYTTTYAHLKKFRKDIEEYVKSQQYNRESFNVDLFPLKNMLKVKKGDTIAWSGNTGSSGGPHLHFEIRDPNNYSVNPLLFGFDEIIDNTRPTVLKLALHCLDINARIEGKHGRKEYRPRRSGNEYVITDTISAYGNIGIDFAGFDRLDGASNKNGISYVALICNDSVCYEQKLEKFSFSRDRCINTHIDYKTYLKEGVRYQRCYKVDGNELDFYTRDINDGKIFIKEGETYEIKLSTKDSYGNETNVIFNIKGERPELNVPNFNHFAKPEIEWTIDENVLEIAVKNYEDYSSGALIYVDSTEHIIPVSYFGYNYANYLWDMRKGLPDSVVFCNSSLKFNFKEAFPSGQVGIFNNEDISIYIPASALFDTLYFDYEKEEDGTYRIDNILTPLFKNVEITLKDTSLRSEKANVYQKKWGNRYYFQNGRWSDKGISFTTRSLGNFVVLKDTIPPYVRLHRKTSYYISFKISDNLSGIKDFNAYLNGKWVLMNYDHKRALLWIDDAYWSKKIVGDFKLVVKDNEDNETVYTTKFY